jgi:hypothetical protein
MRAETTVSIADATPVSLQSCVVAEFMVSDGALVLTEILKGATVATGAPLGSASPARALKKRDSSLLPSPH